jgi:type IV pilus assembly protein PilE
MNKNSGFSLLEILIVMAIIAILLMSAYPLYNHYLIKGRRNAAELKLLYLAGQLENFYNLQNTYQGASLEALGMSAYTDDHSYQLAIQSLTENSYIIAAIPLKTQLLADTQCGTLAMNEQGVKSVSSSASVAVCWN